MTVHVAGDAHANAELVLSGPHAGAPLRPVELETTTLSIDSSGERVFSGRITELETRLPAGGEPVTVVHARGTAPEAGSTAITRLRFGAELVSGSVRRQVGGSTARCLTTERGLRLRSAIDVTTADPAFDGLFAVVELWHRFDARRGLWAEFVATRGRAPALPPDAPHQDRGQHTR